MPNSFSRLYTLVFVLLCLPSWLFAQDFPIRYLDISKGLSNNSVMNIYQDSDGYMWFGTYDGLNRYDGYECKVFRNNIGDTNSIIGNTIYTIVGDSAHNIWVGGQNGASVYQPFNGKFSRLWYTQPDLTTPQLLTDLVHQIRRVGSSTMLLGTQQQGLLVCNSSNRFAEGIPLFINGKKTVSYDVTVVEPSIGGRFCWIFIKNAGVYQFDIESKQLKLFSTSILQANCMSASADGSLWIGTDEGLFNLNTQTGLLSSNLIPFKIKVTSTIVDKFANVVAGTDGAGVFFVEKGSNKAIVFGAKSISPLVKSNAVWALYEDKGGRIWFGTLRGGVSMMDASPKHFAHIRDNKADLANPTDNFILSFCEDNLGNVLIGTDGAGLRYWDRKNNILSTIATTTGSQKISSNFITNIIKDSQGDTWLSTWFGGINRLKKDKGGIDNFVCHNPFTKQDDPNIWLVYEDSRKNIWASATNPGSLYLFNRPKNNFEIFDTAVTDVQCLTETGDGKIWAGNYLHLMEIDVATKTHRKWNIGYPVRSLLEDAAGQLWVGTQEGGLLLFNRATGEIKRYTIKDGLPSNTILRLLQDKEGNIWMSTYNGLARFTPQNGQFQNYSSSDGLQSNQFSYNAGLVLSNGEFLFGGINGFNVFRPENIRQNIEMPLLHVTGVKVSNTSIQEHPYYITQQNGVSIQQIKVPFDEAAFAIDFAALEYSMPDKINYAYFLEGWDKTWNYTAHNRTAIYTHLNEGVYTLRIKSTNAAGIWNTQETTLQLIVLPPWYRTWWAYVLYVGIIGLIAFVYVRYRKKQTQLQYEVQIANIEKQKEKELNENKLNFFTNISHEFRTPLTLIINPLKDVLYKKNGQSNPADLNVVYRNAKRLLSLVDQLLLFRKADSDADSLRVGSVDFNDLCDEVFLCFVQQAQSKQLQYSFEFDDKLTEPIYCDREKVEIAAFNLIANAIKYTPVGGRIVVSVSSDDKAVKLSVSDTGPGINHASQKKIFNRFFQANDLGTKSGFGIGLYVSQKFAQLHGGFITCKSEVGNGAVFVLSLLKGKAHFKAQDVFEKATTKSLFLQELAADSTGVPNELAPESENYDDDEAVMVETQKDLPAALQDAILGDVAGDTPVMLVVDDNPEIRQYLAQVFAPQFTLQEALGGESALEMARTYMPDIIISDVVMQGGSGIELCVQLKADENLRHIPIILLSASSSADIKLKGIELGADDYITKPFDKDLLVARVNNLLQKQNSLQQYFFNEVTLQQNPLKISEEYKQFLDRCIAIVEKNIDKDDFNVKALVAEIGLSQSNLYRKVKAVSGQSISSFIRFIRLRKAASLLVNTQCNVNEASFQAGISDVKYFRKQFQKLFGMTPTEYIKKYRKPFQKQYSLNEKAVK
jgi:signal transduction histidine kinase/ligand-binding sensor domain-containing protein/DNA-binding response OmpR family regulator